MATQVITKLSDLLIEKHREMFFDALDHRHVHYSASGGRGGVKSSAISLIIPLLMTQPENSNVHAVIFRKVANTLRDSVFSQMSASISQLGLDEFFKKTVSPMEMTYIPTGQKILFRGADEPEKIKSIKAPFGYFGITWFEELDQFYSRAEIRTMLQSTMRGGGEHGKFWNFESFNPPISMNNWANADLLDVRDDRLAVKSCYLDVPTTWLSDQFFSEAEYLKKLNPLAYEHEYLGVPTGTGGTVFPNLKLERIPDAAYKRFDKLYQGIDWGWFPDPFAFIRAHYDAARQTIYILDELVVNEKSNEWTANWIKERKFDRIITICDSAEPKSIHDVGMRGIKVDAAIKGPDSVPYGMKWLQRRQIVIDPKRTPRAAKEFSTYEYERDRYGEFVEGYPDKNNHTIDALRYAFERTIMNTKTSA